MEIEELPENDIELSNYEEDERDEEVDLNQITGTFPSDLLTKPTLLNSQKMDKINKDYMIAKQLEDEAVQKDLDNISFGSSSDEKEDPV